MDKFAVTQHSEDVGSSSQDVIFLFLTPPGSVFNDFAKERDKVNIVKWKDNVYVTLYDWEGVFFFRNQQLKAFEGHLNEMFR